MSAVMPGSLVRPRPSISTAAMSLESIRRTRLSRLPAREAPVYLGLGSTGQPCHGRLTRDSSLAITFDSMPEGSAAKGASCVHSGIYSFQAAWR